MNKGNFYAASVAVVVGLFLAGCSTTLRDASGPQAGGASVSSAPSQVAKVAPAGRPSEGIKVRGHWLIEVRNPDGTLASRTEFNNALNLGGPTGLAKVLSREITVGLWSIFLTGNPKPCTGNVDCVITESNSPSVEAHVFKTLTVVRNGSSVVLAGTATVANTTSINGVATTFLNCAPSTPPASTCVVGPIIDLTVASVSVAVVAGQQVQVTVVISFS